MGTSVLWDGGSSTADSEAFTTPEASPGAHRAPLDYVRGYRSLELAGEATMRLLWLKQTADG
jgi:hypothetical protein